MFDDKNSLPALLMKDKPESFEIGSSVTTFEPAENNYPRRKQDKYIFAPLPALQPRLFIYRMYMLSI
jgi:hypothetical protein